jgi:hypothetical protein
MLGLVNHQIAASRKEKPHFAVFPQSVTVLRTNRVHSVVDGGCLPICCVNLKDLEISMKYTQRNANAAIALLAHSDEQPELLPAVGEGTSTTALVRRARIIRSLIKTRAMMQETRNRSSELQSALERFKERKAKIAGG